MKIVSYDDPRLFSKDTEDFLLSRPGENHLLYDLSHRVEEFITESDPATMLVIKDGGGNVEGVALRTDRAHSFILSAMSEEALSVLVTHLKKVESPGGVVGEKGMVRKLEKMWEGLQFDRVRELGFYSLETAIEPRAVNGRETVATIEDFSLVWDWFEAFELETKAGLPTKEWLKRAVKKNDVFLWLDPKPVAMAIVTGATQLGAKISLVYTPVEKRGRGYASNIVYCLSKELLSQGHKRCFLFTDLSNPTSNSIYQKVGYEFKCHYREWKFA